MMGLFLSKQGSQAWCNTVGEFLYVTWLCGYLLLGDEERRVSI